MEVRSRELGVGEQAPDFVSQDLEGNRVRLGDLIRGKRAVLLFYRGGWCPFCNEQLSAIARDYDKFRALGATVVAVSCEEVEKGRELSRKIGIPFPLLSDTRFEAIDIYGVRDSDPSAGARARGVTTLSKPAAFVIDDTGKVVYKHVGKSARDRPSNDELLRALGGGE